MTKAIAKEYNGLKVMGNDVIVITMNKDVPEFYKRYYENMDVDVLGGGQPSMSTDSVRASQIITVSGIRALDYVRSTIMVFKKLKIEESEIILFHEIAPAVLALPYLFISKRKYAIYLHDNSFMALSKTKSMCTLIKKRLSEIALKWLITRSAITLCVSPTLEVNIKERVGSGNVVCLPLGIDTAEELPQIDQRKDVITYSFWDRWRKPEIYLKVASLLPNNTKMIIAGRWHDVKYLNEFRQRIDDLKLAHKVILRPDIPEEEKNRMLSTSIAYVRFGFDEEGMPGGVLEALGFGCPVIVNKGLGALSYLENGKNGFIVESPEQAADVVVRLSKDRDLLEIFSRASYLCSKKHGWRDHNIQLNRFLSKT
ncbi:Glycosyl transferases group 1 [Thermoplasmatales archaeon]|nr:Glycosyl transferases group 1 [Thermoplasmatales archaeon]